MNKDHFLTKIGRHEELRSKRQLIETNIKSMKHFNLVKLHDPFKKEI